MKKWRLDQFLVTSGKTKTRSQGRMLVKKGAVLVNGKIINKAGFEVLETDEIEIQEEIYVSRGAFKLKAAIEAFGVSFTDVSVADIGASTGGFTEVALNEGASRVFAIDVGHDQLAQSLLNDSRVSNLEGVNIKLPLALEEKVDIAVIDLSFISLTKVMINVKNLLKKQGEVIVLIKPQFEVGKENLGKGGVVKDDKLHQFVVDKVHGHFKDLGFKIKGTIDSPIKGKDGNKEFLSYLTLASS